VSAWTVIVPMKAEGKRKTRLAAHLCAIGREELSENLFYHVIRTLRQSPSVARLVILSDGPPLMGGVEWMADEGLGLNAELERVRAAIGGPIAIIHADLPLLEIADVEALLEAALGSIAIAPDSHGSGTNALALGVKNGVRLAFGPNSFAHHYSQAPEAAIITGRHGLALDVDTVDDLDEAIRLGFSDR
jgi:2-phospho-L-lactate/phosphoenolpyruvate guanylyltransferase